MKFAVKLSPVSRNTYLVVVQAQRAAYSSPIKQKLGVFSVFPNVSYVELSLKHVAFWLSTGTTFANKRLFQFLIHSYGRD
jgi:ribosomal protein S16